MTESLGTYLNDPVLFAPNLPSTINYDHLRAMFKNLLVTRITLSAGYLVSCPTKEGWTRLLLPGLQTAKIEFADIAEAEKAFATINCLPIPNIFPPEILKLLTSPNTETPVLPRDTDGYSGRRTPPSKAGPPEHNPVSSLDAGVLHTASEDNLDCCIKTQRPLEEGFGSQRRHDGSFGREMPTHQQRPQVVKQTIPNPDTLQEKTRVESLLKQAEIDRDHWRRQLDVSQSRVKVLEFQIEEERKKAAKEMECQRDAADCVARDQARKDAFVAEIERCRQRDARLCEWKRSTALERFLLVLDEFEGRTRPVSETQPLTFEGIPWPTLENPMVPSFQADAITWGKVEAFFLYAKRTMPHQQYSKLVERVHRLFHPDKWRARRVLDRVPDMDLRQSVEQSVNIVAQAMTPIWRESKGRVWIERS